MKYIVYTDGAGNTELCKIACSYIVYTSDTFIHSDYKGIEGFTNPTQAETIAVGVASGFLCDNVDLKPDDIVEFNIDCVSTIDFCRKYAIDNKTENVPSKNPIVIMAVQLLRKLDDRCKVQLYKVRGHKYVTNPNSYVDRLAKLGVRK